MSRTLLAYPYYSDGECLALSGGSRARRQGSTSGLQAPALSAAASRSRAGRVLPCSQQYDTSARPRRWCLSKTPQRASACVPETASLDRSQAHPQRFTSVSVRAGQYTCPDPAPLPIPHGGGATSRERRETPSSALRGTAPGLAGGCAGYARSSPRAAPHLSGSRKAESVRYRIPPQPPLASAMPTPRVRFLCRYVSLGVPGCSLVNSGGPWYP